MRVDPAADTARLERVFGIAVATLTALGTLLLGMGERNVVLPVLAVIVAAGSVYLTDLRGWFWLNNTAANVAAVIALILAGGDLLRFDAERQLLAAANLLIYLQFVLLFRPKTYAVYWLLVVLSLTQVAVASAVNFELSFGILMIVYLFVALTVQLLFYRFREIRRHLDYEALQTVAAGGAPDDVAARLNPAGRMHWPLGRQTACFAPRGQSQLVGQVERTGVAAQAALLGGAALILTVGMFVLVPRLGDSQ